MHSKRIAAMLFIAAAFFSTGTTVAQANNGSPPATCDFQRWYPGSGNCDGQPWLISIAAECAQIKAESRRLWTADRVCNPVKEMNRPRPKVWIVKKGDTLWRISVYAYSTGTEGPQEHAGQQYRRIMRLNHLRSTTIHVGQRLRLR